MRIAAAGGFALLASGACNLPPIDTDTAVRRSCPGNYVPARSASIVFTGFAVDQVPQVPGFDAAATYDGVPAACIAPDGYAATWIFDVGNQPFGRIDASAEEVGYYDLLVPDDAAFLLLDMFGAPERPRFRVGDWTQGTWFVRQVGTTFELELQSAYGTNPDGRTLSVTLVATASR